MEVTRTFMSWRFLQCVKVPNNAFASSFVLKLEKQQWKHINYCSKHTVKMQWAVRKCLTGSVYLKRIEPLLPLVGILFPHSHLGSLESYIC